MVENDVEHAPAGRSWVVPLSAIVFALLFVIGIMAAGAATDTADKSAAEVLKVFRDNKTGAILSAYFLAVAGLAFLPLAWAAITRVGGGMSVMAEFVARSSALLFAAMLLVAGAMFGSLAGGVVFGSSDDPPADLIRFVPQIGFPVLLVAGGLSAAVFLATVSRAGQAASAVPTWFWVLGYVTAIAMLAGVLFIPMVLLPIWAIAAAFVLKGSRASRPSPTQPASG